MALQGIPKQALNQDKVFFNSHWSRATDMQFISLLVGHIASNAWIVGQKNERAILFSMHDLNRFNGVVVDYELCKNQTKKLHKRYNVWKWLINLPYVIYNPTTNWVHCDDATWKNIIVQEKLAAAYYREGEHSWHDLRRLFDEINIAPPAFEGHSVINISSDTEGGRSAEAINNVNSPMLYSLSSLSYETGDPSMNTDDAFWNEHAWMDQNSRESSSHATSAYYPSPAQSTNSPTESGRSRPPLPGSGRHRTRPDVGSSSIASWSPFKKD